jgi:hypothetical protein
MQGVVLPDIRVPLNDAIIDQLYIDSVDVELNYTIRELDKLSGIDEHGTGAGGLSLDQMYPNPIKSSAEINYRLDDAAPVSLLIYDIGGRLVKTLVSEKQSAGSHSVVWNAEDADPGVYFCRIQTTKVAITRKCVVMK